MNPQGADLLAQLRDIHAAPAAPAWPPAPGWWALFAVLAFFLFLLARRGLRAWRRRRQRLRLLRWVDDIDAHIDPLTAPQAFLEAMNRVFKVVAIQAFPHQSCARLQGEEWAEFLQQSMCNMPDAEHLEILALGPYQPRPEFDPEAMSRLARRWILRHG
jgi:hypothetical protein